MKTDTHTTDDAPSATEPVAPSYTPNPADDMTLANAGSAWLSQHEYAESEWLKLWKSIQEEQAKTVISHGTERTHLRNRKPH